MKKTFLWQLSGFVFTCIAGTLLHFVYDWSGQNIVAAVFSGINESTWEHMKILFVPMFFFALAEKHLMGNPPENFWCVKLKGTLLGLVLIPVIFYTYNGVIGPSPDWINIAIFFISALFMYLYEMHLFQGDKQFFTSPKTAFGILCGIALLFVLFTFRTPKIDIFKDPLNKTFGISEGIRP